MAGPKTTNTTHGDATEQMAEALGLEPDRGALSGFFTQHMMLQLAEQRHAAQLDALRATNERLRDQVADQDARVSRLREELHHTRMEHITILSQLQSEHRETVSRLEKRLNKAETDAKIDQLRYELDSPIDRWLNAGKDMVPMVLEYLGNRAGETLEPETPAQLQAPVPRMAPERRNGHTEDSAPDDSAPDGSEYTNKEKLVIMLISASATAITERYDEAQVAETIAQCRDAISRFEEKDHPGVVEFAQVVHSVVRWALNPETPPESPQVYKAEECMIFSPLVTMIAEQAPELDGLSGAALASLLYRAGKRLKAVSTEEMQFTAQVFDLAIGARSA